MRLLEVGNSLASVFASSLVALLILASSEVVWVVSSLCCCCMGALLQLPEFYYKLTDDSSSLNSGLSLLVTSTLMMDCASICSCPTSTNIPSHSAHFFYKCHYIHNIIAGIYYYYITVQN